MRLSQSQPVSRMLSTSFIVSASPVLTSPLYENTQRPGPRHNDPYEGSEQIYNLTSDSRRVKRSFSVGRTSDLGKKTTSKRSVSQSRESGGVEGPRQGVCQDGYHSPIQRRPLPSIPSVPSIPQSQPSPTFYQRSLLSDIYSFTKDYGFYDKFTPETESGNRNVTPRGRSRIPVALNNSKNILKTRAVTQMDLLKPKLSLEREDGNIIKKGLMWIQQDKIFSTWKERFVILTNSHLQIFKKGTTKFSDMGTFINKVSLASVSQLTLEERRGYLTLLLVTANPTVRLLLRRPDGLTDWLGCLTNLTNMAQHRDTGYRRQLSEYGTFQNISRVSRDSLDESPCSSIGRHYSSPRQRPQSFKPGENLYGGSPGLSRDRIYQEPLRLNQGMFS